MRDIVIHGIRMRQTTTANPRVVEVHPFQLSKILHNADANTTIDVIVLPEDKPLETLTDMEENTLILIERARAGAFDAVEAAA
jgi:hypothetical protein